MRLPAPIVIFLGGRFDYLSLGGLKPWHALTRGLGLPEARSLAGVIEDLDAEQDAQLRRPELSVDASTGAELQPQLRAVVTSAFEPSREESLNARRVRSDEGA